MAKMLKHKETGELFIYTPLLAQNSFLDLVVEDPVAAVIAEMKVVDPAPVVETPFIETVVETVSAAQVAKPTQTTKVKKAKTAVDDDLAAALE